MVDIWENDTGPTGKLELGIIGGAEYYPMIR